MSLLIVFITAGLAVIYLLRLVVGVAAKLLAVYLLRRSRRVGEALIRAGAAHCGTSDYDRRPSRSERRLMRAHLKLALKKTELASLLPALMTGAGTMVDGG